MRRFHEVGICISAGSFGFSAFQAAVSQPQRSFFLALAFYSIVALLHDFRELRKCRGQNDVLLTGAEFREIAKKLAELDDGGHRLNPDHLAVVLGWPRAKVLEVLRLFRRIGIVS